MLLFGHAGITLGIVLLTNKVLSKGVFIRAAGERGHLDRLGEKACAGNCGFSARASWNTSLANRLDVGALMIGSLLPDLIDKPIGHIFLRAVLNNGRIFGHTFLFFVLLTLAGVWLYRHRGSAWLLVLSLGTLGHLVFDQMWAVPRTLFWPIFGLAFDRLNINWIPDLLHALLTDPGTYIPELIGAAVLLWFLVTLVRRRRIAAFVRCWRITAIS